MTDNEVVKILTTDSFNDNPRRYYEAMNLAVNGFIQYAKIKEIVDKWDNISDVQDAEDSMGYYFSKILNIFREDG